MGAGTLAPNLALGKAARLPSYLPGQTRAVGPPTGVPYTAKCSGECGGGEAFKPNHSASGSGPAKPKSVKQAEYQTQAHRRLWAAAAPSEGQVRGGAVSSTGMHLAMSKKNLPPSSANERASASDIAVQSTLVAGGRQASNALDELAPPPPKMQSTSRPTARRSRSLVDGGLDLPSSVAMGLQYHVPPRR